MRHAKSLVFTLAMVLAVMALAGVSSAGAKGKFCSTSGNGGACAGTHGKEYTGEIHAVLANTTGTTEKHFVFTSGFFQKTCTESTIQGLVTNSATATGKITGMTFGGCTNNINGSACTASSNAGVGEGWHLTGTSSGKGDGNGTLDVKDPTIITTCNILGANRTCRYTTAEAQWEFFGSDTTPVIEVNMALQKEAPSDGLCSNVATLEGVYHLTTPTSLWIT